MRIAFVSPPFAGHFNPLLVLARAARDAGYEVDFVTGARKLAIVERHSLRPIALRSVGEDTLESIANTAAPVRNHPIRLLAQFRENLRLLPIIAAELEDIWKSRRPSLIVADSVAPVAGILANRLKIPWITTIATPFAIETHSGTPTYCGGWMPPKGFFGSLRDACGRAAIRGFKQAVGAFFGSEFRQLGLRQVYRADGSEVIYSPHAILGFGLRELEFNSDWPPQFEMIGPVIASPDHPRVNLPDSRPRVLVTLGTHLLWAKRTLADEVRSLAAKLPQVHFVVSLGDPAASAPASFDRISAVPYLAYDQGLDQFDAVIHHGGAGVTYAAILAGVPSLVVPRDYDQFDYAARIVYHKLGLRSGSLANAAPALTQLLDSSQWPALAHFQQMALAYEPEKRFLETVAKLIHSF